MLSSPRKVKIFDKYSRQLASMNCETIGFILLMDNGTLFISLFCYLFASLALWNLLEKTRHVCKALSVL